jgi:regulator of replication initiation timing
MPEHLKHFNTQQPNASNTTNSTSPQHSHPGSSASALSSQDSEAITELNQQLKEMSSKLGAEMEMLRKQNDELRMALAKEKCENAEKGARIEEIRNNAAEKDRMYQQWNNMCANMLGTIESIKK